ncbi:heat shock protein 70-like protein [Cordyline virus 2]|uniref:Heat shock protein 70-like protein n=1 Tax=Cordyline virus 2 TaxID=1177751 RepID=L7P045_9CLOS|nr:heat shock protein 70-like protein [Cordyline virus 2]AFJ05048.1 heat shock protein 70-like protein [Cordyline virus 2]
MPKDCRAGVDFGTTFSTISAIVDGVATPLILEGSPYIPTVITFFENKVAIGELAKTISDSTKANHMYYDLKRWVGVNRGNFISLKDKLKPQYECRFEEDDCQMGGIGSPPVFRSVRFLIATYLDILIKLFEENFNVKVTNLNVSVPADYYTFQRAYMRNVVNSLNIKVDRILNEPSAAAIYSITANPDFSDFVIFDFGGGTFDVSYVKKSGKIIMICDTQGDLFLGGRDIDKEIQKHIKKYEDVNVPTLSLPYLKENVSLGKSQTFNVLNDEHKISHVSFRVEDLDLIVKPFAMRSCKILYDVLTRNEISNAIICLVGGSSLLKEVQRQVSEVARNTNNKTYQDKDLRLSVSFGCSSLHLYTDDPNFTYVDVNSHCVFEIDEMFKPVILIRKPMPIPFKIRERRRNEYKFTTAVDIYEGDSQWFLDSQVLVKDSYNTDAVSKLNEGYYRVIQYDLDGNINVWIENNDSTNKRILKSSITTQQPIKLEKFERIQVGSNALYCVLAELVRYHNLDEAIKHIDPQFSFELKKYIEANGGSQAYIEK